VQVALSFRKALFDVASFIINNGKQIQKGALIFIGDVLMPSGMTLIDCMVFSSSGKFWASPPSRPRVGRDGVVMKDVNGKQLYSPLIEFASKELRDRWSDAVVAAVRQSHPEVFAP
jgi:hypothetical protein